MTQHLEPNYDQVNFLPDWFKAQTSRKASNRRQLMLLGVMIVGLFVLWLMTDHRRAELKDHLASLNDQLILAQQQVDEVNRLKEQQQVLSRQDRIYRRLVRPINYSQVTGTLASLMPTEICVTELMVHTESYKIRKPAPKGSKKQYETVIKPVIEVEVEGRAPSNVVIANFVGQLASSNLFQQVKMVKSRESRWGRYVVREFRMTMQVPLDVEYVAVTRVEGEPLALAESGAAAADSVIDFIAPQAEHTEVVHAD